MIDIDRIPKTVDGRLDWKEYFSKHAKVGDQFVVAKSTRSGIQRQASDCGYSAKSSAAGQHQILITVCELDTISRRVLDALATLTEKQLYQIHRGCVQARILPPL
jgi:hypothetical protein